MKKISTLVMSLATASAIAAPMSRPVIEHSPAGQRALIEASFELDRETKAQMRHSIISKFCQNQAPRFSQLTVQRAPEQEADIIFECNKLGNSTYIAGTKDWFFNFRDNSYGVELDLVNLDNPKCFTGTYNTEDCLMRYCSFWNYQENWAAAFTELTVTCVAFNDDYDPTLGCEVTGQGVLDNGKTVAFHLLDPGPVLPSETVVVNAEVTDYNFYYSGYNGYTGFILNDPETGISAEIYYYGIFGSFKDNKIFAEVIDNGQVEEYVNGTLDVDLKSDGNIHLDAELVCQNAVKYVFSAQTPFVVEDQISIEAHNLFVEDYYGVLYFLTASTAEYPTIEVVTYTNPYVAGELTDDFRVTLFDAAGTQISSLAVMNATISLDENGKPVVDGTFIGTDYNEYTLHMDLQTQDIENEVEINVDGIELTDLTASSGAFQLYYLNQAQGINLSVVYDANAVVSGHYDTISPTYANYCAMTYGGIQNPIVWCVTDLEINQADKTFSVNGSCQAGSTRYTFSGVGNLPRPQGDSYDDPNNNLELLFSADEIDEYEINNATGDVLLSALNADNKYVALNFIISGNEFEPGVYTINSSFAPGTVTAGGIDYYQGGVYPSFAGTLVGGYLDVPLWLMHSGTVTVAFDVEGLPSIEVNAVNTWGCTAHIVINPIIPVGIHKIAAEPSRSGKFIEAGNIVIRTESGSFNALGVRK